MSGAASTVHAEWTKFRTVRGWVIGMLVGRRRPRGRSGCSPGRTGPAARHGHRIRVRPTPVGPGGEEVTDGFTFVHQPLAGDGSITVRVAVADRSAAESERAAGYRAVRPGLVPWAKAGLIVKAGTTEGSAYAAVMVTGGHGVRMQARLRPRRARAAPGVRRAGCG